MRFDSVHPTEISDEQACLIFLALATKWEDLDKDELADVFVRGSLYLGVLPRQFGARREDEWSTARIGGTVGVLVERLRRGGFRVHMVDHQRIDLTVVAASDSKELAQLWDRGDDYGRREDLVIRAAELGCRDRYRENPQDTLRRAVERRDPQRDGRS